MLAADAVRRVGIDVPAEHLWIVWDGCLLRSGHGVVRSRNFGHESDTEGLKGQRG